MNINEYKTYLRELDDDELNKEFYDSLNELKSL